MVSKVLLVAYGDQKSNHFINQKMIFFLL
uniref:Uncharacterized protein n=1 Tax=Arundo donax TaxID=35708 RepID=A0A0A9CI11_ARUDO